MENASKALIIAGAILISIILIGLGVAVINMMNKPKDQASTQIDAQAVEMFNATFTGYAGKQNAASVKSLMTSVASTAGASGKTISVTKNGASSSVGEVQSKVEAKKYYTVKFSYDTDGYINGVDVSGF